MTSLAEWAKGIEDSVDVRKFEINAVNSAEYKNSERTFSQYLDQPVEEYFGYKKMLAWPARFEEYYGSAREFLEGDILELGAGASKFSAMLSKQQSVVSVTCVEFSETMIKVIAPRVFLHFGGDLSKATFVISDMHDVENFSEKKYDAIVFHSALHHVFLPFAQIRKLKEMLKPGGSILCFSEPATSTVTLPTKANRAWILGQKNHQVIGNNENFYRPRNYKDFFTTLFEFDFEYLVPRPSKPAPVSRPRDLLRSMRQGVLWLLRSWGLDRLIWPVPLSLSFRATSPGPGLRGLHHN